MVEIICAGFGGQGVLTTGLIIAHSAMMLGKEVTWYPSYGSEMRGGTANCTVKISDGKIASPCTKKPDILCALNAPAVDKFENSIKPSGYLFVNDSLVDPHRSYRSDIHVVRVPMSEIAIRLGNPKGANLVMLGAVAQHTGIFTLDELEEQVAHYFAKKGKVNPKNADCLRAGAML